MPSPNESEIENEYLYLDFKQINSVVISRVGAVVGSGTAVGLLDGKLLGKDEGESEVVVTSPIISNSNSLEEKDPPPLSLTTSSIRSVYPASVLRKPSPNESCILKVYVPGTSKHFSWT